MELTKEDQVVLSNANYIHTTAPKFKKNGGVDFNGFVHRASGTSLISLIYGLEQSAFGYNTVNKVMKEIDKYNDMHLGASKGVRILDSGGYSIIAGVVKSCDVLKVINCYQYAIEHLSQNQTRILTLDVPFFINEPNKCTVKNIYDMNRMSLEDTIKAVKTTPELKNKLMFVQHWKMRKQYKIFNDLYRELELHKYVQQYAVGGLVGIGGTTNINFAPFIGPLFLQFSRYLKYNQDYGFFNCHILGVYQKAARFCIMFLEKLFRSMNEVNQSSITYDSINYMMTSQFKILVKGHTYLRVNTSTDYIHYDSLLELDRAELKYVYSDDVIPEVISDLDKVKNNERLKDVGFGVPLYAYGQMEMDKLFKLIVDEFQIVNMFKTANNGKLLFNQLKAVTNTIQSRYKSILGPQFAGKALINLQMIWVFYSSWYVKERTDEKIEDLMQKFITKVNFPADLV